MAFLQSPIGEPLRAGPRWPKLAALMNLPTEAVIAMSKERLVESRDMGEVR